MLKPLSASGLRAPTYRVFNMNVVLLKASNPPHQPDELR